MTPEQREAIRRYVDANPHFSTSALVHNIAGRFNVSMSQNQVSAIRIRAGGHGRTPRSRMDNLTAPKE